ncbi:MAG: N-succinyl-L,L-diaminopimelate desuccinylase [Firmicutes bacterium]|nr:N-succinyl-L,L-diaminopimelate desuccinylase [Bacillota bacterium]MDI6705430.1 M20 family metallopeptidase [Bacillota bacterium]
MTGGLIKSFKERISEQEIVELIKDLVRIQSYPGIKCQETGVAEYIHRFFEKEGIESEVIPVVDGRCNVVARIKGTGGGKTLLLTGHTDTVPPYDMPGDPFEVKIQDRRMTGRGVVDMKGAIACMMAAMAAIKRAGIELKGDLVFAGVIDEENKSEGTIALIKSGIKADAAIVGEPSQLDICVGHRGLEWFEFYFRGKTVHGGKQKEGINAINKAVKFMLRVEQELLPKIEGRKHPVIGESSMNYGLIRGGTQPSTVAGDCVLQIDRRWVPGEKYEDVVDEYQRIIDALKAEDRDFDAVMKVMDVSLMEDGIIHEPMEIDLNHPIVEVVSKAVLQATGREPGKVPFTAWSDGGLLSTYAKIPTIILGPGDLESAHSAEEYLDIDEVVPAAYAYGAAAIWFCG